MLMVCSWIGLLGVDCTLLSSVLELAVDLLVELQYLSVCIDRLIKTCFT